MNTKQKTFVGAMVIMVAVVAIICVTVVVVVKQMNEISHLQTDGVSLTLTRDKLTYNNLTEDGLLIPATDNDAKDFSAPTSDNIFGISSKTVVVPGSMYSADLTVSSADSGFCYWLEVKLNNVGSVLAQELSLSVTTQDGQKQNFRLSDGCVIGSANNPIDVVQGSTSTFTVAMQLADNFSNNNAQGEFISFDLVVHASKI